MSFAKKRKAERIKEFKTGVASTQASVVSESNLVKRYRVVHAAMESTLSAINDIANHEERKVLKLDFINTHRDYISEYLNADEKHQNAVLAQYMIWSFDVGEIEDAWELALECIKQDQAMPERFNRTIEAFISDSLLDWATDTVEADGDPNPYFETAYKQVKSGDWDLFEATTCKYHKLAARMLEQEEDYAGALELYETADKSYSKAKVKTKIDQLKKKLEKQTS